MALFGSGKGSSVVTTMPAVVGISLSPIWKLEELILFVYSVVGTAEVGAADVTPADKFQQS